jgi:hypothetical protein
VQDKTRFFLGGKKIGGRTRDQSTRREPSCNQQMERETRRTKTPKKFAGADQICHARVPTGSQAARSDPSGYNEMKTSIETAVEDRSKKNRRRALLRRPENRRKTSLTGKNQDGSDWIESEREKSPREETNKRKDRCIDLAPHRLKN